jgi:hypothetical protein
MEGERKDLMDDKLPHRNMLEVELADAVTEAVEVEESIEANPLAGAIQSRAAKGRRRYRPFPQG